MEEKFVVSEQQWDVWDDHHDHEPNGFMVNCPYKGMTFDNIDSANEYAESAERENPLNSYVVKKLFKEGDTLYERVDGEFFLYEGCWYRKFKTLVP